MNDHDGAVWLDANLRYRKVCSFGTPYCARNVGLCKPRWPANARDDCSLPCTHGGPPKKPPPPMPDCSPGRASRWLLLLPRRTVQADCANPRCRLAGARRPCAVVLEGVLACRRAAPSVVVVHVPSATPRSCAWATCSRTCLQSTPFVRQDLALPSPPKSCMAALKLACKGRLRLAWKAKGGQQCLAHSCLKPRWRWTQAAPYRRQA